MNTLSRFGVCCALFAAGCASEAAEPSAERAEPSSDVRAEAEPEAEESVDTAEGALTFNPCAVIDRSQVRDCRSGVCYCYVAIPRFPPGGTYCGGRYIRLRSWVKMTC